MLHFIRDRAQGWIAWFIVGLISIPFALWGVNSYMTGQADVVVAKVNGADITQSQLQQSLQQYRDQMRSMLGEQFDPAMFEGPAARRNILDGLIEQKLLQDAGKSLGQRVSDLEVSRMIRTTQAFQRDGRFDSDTYAMVLARAGYSPSSYEAQLRVDMLSQELTGNVQTSAFVTDVDVNEALRVDRQRREIAYGPVVAQDFIDAVEVSEDDVRRHYETNQAFYMTPEQLIVDYIRLDVDDIAAGIDVDETALMQFYADNEKQFVGPEQRRASHILIEGDDADAQAEIASIQARLQAGEAFDELARTVSHDSGSASQGGDLGYFQRNVMEPEFEEAVFALEQIGQISEPVLTEFGYHLIQLTDIRSGEAGSYADVRDQVEAIYRRQQAESRYFDLVEQLANLSYEYPESLDAAAGALDVEIQTSQRFSRTGAAEGIAAHPQVVEAAFSQDVLQHDLNSQVIELSDDEVVVVRKHQYVAASVLPYDSVAPAIREQLRFEQASSMAREKGESLLEELKQGADPQQLLAHWQSAQFYQRDSEDISAQVLNRAFAMPRPLDAPQYAGFTADNGNYVLISVSAVEEGAAADVDEAQRQMLRMQLARMQAEAELDAFIASLKAEAKIRIVDESLR